VNVVEGSSLRSHLSGPFAGSSYRDLTCRHCGSPVGRRYIATPLELDSLRGGYSLELASCFEHQLGSMSVLRRTPDGGEVLVTEETAAAGGTEGAPVDRIRRLEGEITRLKAALLKVNDQLRGVLSRPKGAASPAPSQSLWQLQDDAAAFTPPRSLPRFRPMGPPTSWSMQRGAAAGMGPGPAEGALPLSVAQASCSAVAPAASPQPSSARRHSGALPALDGGPPPLAAASPCGNGPPPRPPPSPNGEPLHGRSPLGPKAATEGHDGAPAAGAQTPARTAEAHPPPVAAASNGGHTEPTAIWPARLDGSAGRGSSGGDNKRSRSESPPKAIQKRVTRLRAQQLRMAEPRPASAEGK